MNPLKLYSLALLFPALTGCVTPNESLPHHVYKDSKEFSTTQTALPSILTQLTQRLSHREEVGVIHLSLQGGQLSANDKQHIESDLSSRLLLPIELTHTPSNTQEISGHLEVTLVPDTCRYNPSVLPVSRQACLQLRNQYLSSATPSAWHQGLTYIESNSALSTGAVQRLHNNQLKSAEKQSVTGED
ncbi:hypothetical protein [Vibrio caribbeanicus]|uniref:hypothetical protein n=1 Tax=Vibrio caribbeanicus TaxID=701175 RepID=UPI00068EC73A|nr:hypothetical protein [Vibrio caribbeanicus]